MTKNEEKAYLRSQHSELFIKIPERPTDWTCSGIGF